MVTERVHTSAISGRTPDLEYLEIRTDSIRQIDTIAKVTKQKYYFVPLLFVSFWNATHKCALNSRMILNSFKRELVFMLDSTGNRTQLEGKKIRVYFDKLPLGFMYTYKGYNISAGYLFLYMYYNSHKENIYPFLPMYRLRYEILEGEMIIKSGNVTTMNPTKPATSEMRATKTLVWRFIDEFYSDISTLNRTAARKIVSELQ